MVSGRRTSVKIQRRFAAHPKRVFDAWVEPAIVRTWFAALHPGGQEVVRIDWRGRKGVPFKVVVGWDAGEVEHAGEYLEVVPARRLVFTWVVPAVSKETMLVSVDFAPATGAWGGTELTLKHERVVVADVENVETRWQAVLEAIGAIVDAHAGAGTR
jgi:uncharacterized protein YndB with AHSA1/START domain